MRYLDSLVRGVYAMRDLPVGHILTDDDFYLAVPLQKEQLSCRELMRGQVMIKACAGRRARSPSTWWTRPTPTATTMRARINDRGL